MEALTTIMDQNGQYRAMERVEKLYMDDPRMILAGLPWPRAVSHMRVNSEVNARILKWQQQRRRVDRHESWHYYFID